MDFDCMRMVSQNSLIAVIRGSAFTIYFDVIF